jgi:hypothetical protein
VINVDLHDLHAWMKLLVETQTSATGIVDSIVHTAYGLRIQLLLLLKNEAYYHLKLYN